jgi:hypothetical protein
MSISSLSKSNQTGLVPQTLLGYSSNGVSAIEINPTAITIAGDLNTPTPIYVGISASTGLTTTLTTGLDVNCDFNMNSNDITNLNTLSSTTGSNLTLSSSDNIDLTATSGTINANSDIVMKDATEPTWNTTLEVSGLSFNIVNGGDTNNINIDAEGGSTITCGFTNIIGTNSTTINPYQIQLDGGGINTTLTPTSITNNDNFSITSSSITGNILLDSSQTDINGGIVNITATSTSVNLNGQTIQLGSSSGNITLTSNNDNIVLDANTDITLTTGSGVCNITSFDSLSILSLDSSITITSNVSSINLLAPTSEVIMTATQATLTDGTGSTTSIAPTLIKVGTQTSGDDLGSISLIGINSTANQVINFSPSNGSSIINNGYVNWYNFPMSITFLHKWQGSFSYPFGSPNTWDISQIQTTSFPSQFLHSTWAVSFSINFHSVGSATADKGFACYIDFIDSASNVFTGFTFNQNTPYAQWYNASTYNATSQTPLTFTMTDYFDFTNATSLDIRLNFYGDNPQTQNYSITSAFTLMTLI